MLRGLWARAKATLAGEPGHRFQDRYHQHQDAGRSSHLAWVLRVLAALLCIAIGIPLIVLPGPAVLFFAMAGALISKDSLMVAKGMDGCELASRKIAALAVRFWRWLRR